MVQINELIAIVSIGLLLAGCGSNLSTNLNSVNVSQENKNQIESMVDEVMKKYNIPGAVIGVWEGDKEPYILEKGVSETETNEPMRADQKVRIASNTKTFTGTMILELVKEGKLSLDSKLSEFYPDIPNAEKITIRQMLGMTSGIHGMYDLNGLMNDYYNNPLKHWEPEEIYNIIVKQKPDFEPDEKAEYSDSNYILLGMIAKKVTGKKVEELIHDKIIRFLNLTSTSFPTDSIMSSPFAHGYRNYPDKDVLSDITTMDPSIAWTGGAMISNAYDLNRWVREVYKGTLLNDELQKERLTFRDMGNNLSYGLAVMKLGNFYGHNGTILGYNTVMLYLPQKDATIIAIINHMNDAEGDSQPAMEMFGKTAKILYPNDAGF